MKFELPTAGSNLNNRFKSFRNQLTLNRWFKLETAKGSLVT